MKKTADSINVQSVVQKVCAGKGSECVYLFQKNQYLTGIIQERAWMTQLNMSDAYRATWRIRTQ